MKPGMSKVRRTLFTKACALALATLAAVALLNSAHAQTKKPISRQGLVNAVKINGLSTAELVGEINSRGVAFEMTADAEQELRGVGARPEVIEAARSNYRAASTAHTQPAHTSPTPRVNTGAPVPAGAPLSKSEIVTMLQGGIPSSRVEQFVEVRGVNFAVTPQITAEIKSAGGDRSLIGAITEKSQTQAASDNTSDTDSPFGSNGKPAANSGPDYDDYMDKVSSAWSAQDWNSAISSAQQAAQLDPSRPQAYQYLGTMLLYARGDYQGAEQAMRAAIERGGSAAFIVYHDHTGNFSNYCQGTFFVTKTGVSFKADNGVDTFETADSNIKEAKTNGWVGSELGAFHIKPIQQINGRNNFNFAPNTRNKAEAQMIIRLISGY
jgi:tetratricopeptide (TPR) repeat protein